MPAFLKVPTSSFFFVSTEINVHASLDAAVRLFSDVLELRVAIRVLLAFDGLLRSAKAIAELIEQLVDGLIAHPDAVRDEQLARQRDGALRAPSQTGLRIPSRRGIDEPLQRGQQFGIDLDMIPAARASAPNVHKVVDLRAVTQFVAPSRDGVERVARCTRDHRKSAAPDRLGLSTRPQPRHALIHRALEHDELRADERFGGHVTCRSCRSRP